MGLYSNFDYEIPCIYYEIFFIVEKALERLPRLTDRREYTLDEIESATFTFSIYTLLEEGEA
jgi:hypothetical protein